MPNPLRIVAAIALVLAVPSIVAAHESFLLWHDHSHAHAGHSHQMEHNSDEHHGHGDEAHAHLSGKEVHIDETSDRLDTRWIVGTGLRYTRFSLEGESAHLWETGLGVAFQVTPWLDVGGELSYGWFDSKQGSADGLMIPMLHADAHIPLTDRLELLVGGLLGFPGEKALVGDHWELEPHLVVRYDTGKWFVETGVGISFILGGEDHLHGDHEEAAEEDSEADGDSHEDEEEGHEEHEEGHEAEEHAGEHGHGEQDFHEVVDPHGKRELHYHAAFGVRLLDERLSLEGRVTGVHVIAGETEDRDYVRVGARVGWRLNDRWSLRTEASVPVTDAERNQWQTSLSLQASF